MFRHSFIREDGFSLIELLVVMSVIVVMIGISGAFSSRFSNEKKTDEATLKLSSQLQLMKLKALRSGVEHMFDFIYESGCADVDPDPDKVNTKCNFVSYETRRGDSNRSSALFEDLASEVFVLHEEITVSPADSIIVFQPNGNVVDETGTLITGVNFIVSPVEDSHLNKCGIVNVNPLGRINVTDGRWDGDASPPVCNPIHSG